MKNLAELNNEILIGSNSIGISAEETERIQKDKETQKQRDIEDSIEKQIKNGLLNKSEIITISWPVETTSDEKNIIEELFQSNNYIYLTYSGQYYIYLGNDENYDYEKNIKKYILKITEKEISGYLKLMVVSVILLGLMIIPLIYFPKYWLMAIVLASFTILLFLTLFFGVGIKTSICKDIQKEISNK